MLIVIIMITRACCRHLKISNHFCRKCPFSSAKKWYFGSSNKKTETTFCRQLPPKMVDNMFVSCVYHFWVGFKPIFEIWLIWGRFWTKFGRNYRAKITHEFMIDFFLKSHRPILYLKRQQKVHPA